MLVVDEEDHRSFAHHVLVDATHRFVLFTIPKIASTQWIRLFMRLDGAPDWRENPHYREDRPFLSRLPARSCTRILNDPAWFKAVFFRDPAERLLSAYLDKFVYQRSYQVDLFEEKDVPFDVFLSFVLDANTDEANPRGLHRRTNPHWRPQCMLANTSKFLEVFDFVGDFDRLRDHGRSLLERLGLWERCGATGWGSSGRSAIFETNDADHRTDARSRMSDYFTDDQLLRTRGAYRDDYALFERIRPEQRP